MEILVEVMKRLGHRRFMDDPCLLIMVWEWTNDQDTPKFQQALRRLEELSIGLVEALPHLSTAYTQNELQKNGGQPLTDPRPLVMKLRDAATKRQRSVFDILRGIYLPIGMSHLSKIHEDFRAVLATLGVAAMQEAGQPLVVPTDLVIDRKDPKEFQDYWLSKATKTYDTYGTLRALDSIPGGLKPKEAAR